MIGAAPTYDQGVMPAGGASGTPFTILTRVLSGEFVAPRDGIYTVYGWGAGGGGSYFGGLAGGRGKKKVRLSKGQKIGVSLGVGGTGRSPQTANYGNAGGSTILTFPDGSSMVCTGGSSGNESSPGTATGADEAFAGGGGPTWSYSVYNCTINSPGNGNAAFPDLPGVEGYGAPGGNFNNQGGPGTAGQDAQSFGAGGGSGGIRNDNAGYTNGGQGAPGACIIKEEGFRG